MNTAPRVRIKITKNGPYVVEGGVPLSRQHIVTNEEGDSLEWRQGDALPVSAAYSLCRCGHSATKPFCDGSHKRVGFDGTETASREPYEAQAQTIPGPALVLEDAESLCAFARFCDTQGSVWNLVAQSDQPHARKLVEHQAGHCPGGRLVAVDRATEAAVEPEFEPSLGLVEDTARDESGPIWVRGGIPVVGVDGHAYEVRNRVALCRCGASANKPYCEAAHAKIHFQDSK
jgi:CDGSH-type Zn-finger protein